MTAAVDPIADENGHGVIAGGILAVSVSVFLLISLPIRDVAFNALNLFTIVLATLAGVLAIFGGRRADRTGLGWGIGLLFIAIVPAAFGWTALLYLPSLVLMVGGAISFLTRPT